MPRLFRGLAPFTPPLNSHWKSTRITNTITTFLPNPANCKNLVLVLRLWKHKYGEGDVWKTFDNCNTLIVSHTCSLNYLSADLGRTGYRWTWMRKAAYMFAFLDTRRAGFGTFEVNENFIVAVGSVFFTIYYSFPSQSISSTSFDTLHAPPSSYVLLPGMGRVGPCSVKAQHFRLRAPQPRDSAHPPPLPSNRAQSHQPQPYDDRQRPPFKVQALKVIICILATTAIIARGSRAVRTQYSTWGIEQRTMTMVQYKWPLPHTVTFTRQAGLRKSVCACTSHALNRWPH